MVFSLYFGTGPAVDAYIAAQRIPDALFMITVAGALGSAFIPTFTARLAQEQKDAAWRLASAVINILLLTLISTSLLSMVFAPWLVRTVVAPALPSEVVLQAASLMRVMLLTTAIFGVSGIVMGILNAHQHFLLPAIAPIFYNLAIIGGAIWGGVTVVGIRGAAWGMVVGAAAHLLVQVPGLIRHGARYVPTLGFRDAGVGEVGRLMAPRVLGMAAVQINIVVLSNLASRLGIGAISALNYAWRVMLLPQGIFAQAVGTAAFPTFSAQAARKEYGAMQRTLAATLRTIIVITLPASVGLMVLGRPVVAVLFERGAFDTSSTQDVAWALALFALGLMAHSVIEVLVRAFYALHNTWTPALAAGGAVLVNVLLSLVLPSLFAMLNWPVHGGLALANALAAFAEMVALLVLLKQDLEGGLKFSLVGVTFRALCASLGMGGLVWGWLQIAPENALVTSVIGVALGVGGYSILALVLGIEELFQVLLFVRHRAAFGKLQRNVKL